jgi:thymidylate synthase (FAD)
LSSARLIGITHPTAETECKTVNDLVAYIARVSNPNNQNNTKTSAKLLKSLMRDSHWSPLEMVNLVIEIKTTRDIARQILRHKSATGFQEFSQRYAVVDAQFVFREARLQDNKNRQNSLECDDPALHLGWLQVQAAVANVAKNAYTWALGNGIAKEQARAVMPEGMTESVLYMNASLRTWVHYCMLRMSNGTQKEHMEIARDCWAIVKQNFPDISEAAEELENQKIEEKNVLLLLKSKYPEIYQDLLKNGS